MSSAAWCFSVLALRVSTYDICNIGDASCNEFSLLQTDLHFEIDESSAAIRTPEELEIAATNAASDMRLRGLADDVTIAWKNANAERDDTLRALARAETVEGMLHDAELEAAKTKEDDELDEKVMSVLLQEKEKKVMMTVTTQDLRDVFRLQANGGRCLNFLHIPKTAGTSIEEDSKVLGNWTNNSEVHGWGIHDNTLHCAHPLGIKAEIAATGGRTGYMCEVPLLAGGKQLCGKHHVPPSLDESVRDAYSQCETFCVVRDPIQRMISEARYSNVICDTEAIEKFVVDFLALEDTNPGSGPGSGWKGNLGCHGLQQTEYIYGGTYDYSQKGEYCQRILKFEELEESFAALMQEFDLPIKFEHHAHNRHCEVTLSKAVQQIIRKAYAKDFDNFGY